MEELDCKKWMSWKKKLELNSNNKGTGRTNIGRTGLIGLVTLDWKEEGHLNHLGMTSTFHPNIFIYIGGDFS